MDFREAYKQIKPAIVAICARISSNPHFPDIIGTGVIIDSSGLVLTNSHVVKAIHKLPRRKSASPEEWPAFCFLFHFIPDKGMATLPLDIVGVGGIEAYSAKNHYGDVPDVGFLRLNVTNLPSAKIAIKFSLQEGQEIAVAGFPMGTRTLRAPGWIHQLSPSLKVGHVAALLPFVCDNPHAILLDSMMQGGNSGSPVFDDKGEIVGVLYGGLNDVSAIKLSVKEKEVYLPYSVPTNLSYAVPNQIINLAVNQFKKIPLYTEKVKTSTLNEYISSKEGKLLDPKSPSIFDEEISEEDIVRLTKKKN